MMGLLMAAAKVPQTLLLGANPGAVASVQMTKEVAGSI
jgi:hypothetical protein